MLQQDEPSDFVIATGEAHSVRECVEIAFDEAGLGDWRALRRDRPRVRAPRRGRPPDRRLREGQARAGLGADDELRGAGPADGAVGLGVAGGALTAQADLEVLLGSCAAPSEAFWRLLELEAVRSVGPAFAQPVLEIGCGDGTFTRLAGMQVDVGTDREPRAVSRARAGGSYREVFELDLHEIEDRVGSRFRTIYANSVLEHVIGLEAALPHVRRTLRPGGRLIATVPLAEMNKHLAARGSWYVSRRQRLLEHHNIWTREQWTTALQRAGFADVDWLEYLPADACRFWDRLMWWGRSAPAAIESLLSLTSCSGISHPRAPDVG